MTLPSPSPHQLLQFTNAPLHTAVYFGLQFSLPAHQPLKTGFWHSRPGAPRWIAGKTDFNWELQPGSAKSRGLGSICLSLTDFGLQLMGKRRRDKKKVHYPLGERNFTADYPTIHGPTLAPFHLLQFSLAVLIQKPQTTAWQPETCNGAFVWPKQMLCFLEADLKRNSSLLIHFYRKMKMDFLKRSF